MNRIFKYIFASAASVVMLSGAAFAQSQEIKTDTKSDPIHLTKTATKNDDGTYTLRLESFVTGYSYTSTTVKKKPLDIVLILDTSYSMRDNDMLVTGWFGTWQTYNGAQAYSNRTNVANKYFLKDGVYCKVNTINRSGNNSNYTYTIVYYEARNNQTKTLTYPSNQTVDFYQLSTTSRNGYSEGQYYGRQRMDVLKEACTSFINSIEAESNPEAPHKVSIIRFNSDGNTARVATLSSNWNSLRNSIQNSLTMNSTTFPSKSFSWAKADLDSDNRDCKKIIVFFTDGAPAEPSDGSWGNSPYYESYFMPVMNTEANKVIANSGLNKKANYDVYTVGTFDEVNTIDDIKNYLQYTSSNYPDATSMTASGEKKSSNYAYFAKDANALNNIFNAISQDIKKNGGAGEESATNANSVTVRDVVTPKFVVPSDAEGNIDNSKIKIYTAASTGVKKAPSFTTESYAYYAKDATSQDANGYSWGDPQLRTDLTLATSVTDGKTTVDVSGFDFSANWVGLVEVIENNVITSSQVSDTGNKLIVEVVIQPDPDDVGGLVPTNDASSGIYITKNGVVSELEAYPKPDDVLVPMDLTIVMKGATKEYTVTKNGNTSTWTGKLYTEGETAIFQVTGNGQTWNVAVTADASGNGKASIKVPFYNDLSKDKYTVTELTAWSYRFNSEVDTTVETGVAAGTKSLTKQLTADDHTFHFVAVDTEDLGGDDIVSRDLEGYFYDEDSKNNKFSSTATPTGAATTAVRN